MFALLIDLLLLYFLIRIKNIDISIVNSILIDFIYPYWMIIRSMDIDFIPITPLDGK